MKNEILSALKYSANDFISGELLSEKFGVSRAAIWKTIKQLRQDGYYIESKSNAGYKLCSSPDKLYEQEVMPLIPLNSENQPGIVQKYIHLDAVDSTNNYAKQLTKYAFSNGTIVVAETQTGGKGRLGKTWTSPYGKSLYLSFLLTPSIQFENAVMLTLLAACSTVRAIESVCPEISAMIKWPNDIVVNGKKVCGILAEMSGEVEQLSHVIIGIGINVNWEQQDFPDELHDSATSLSLAAEKMIDRKALTASLIHHFNMDYQSYLSAFSFDTSFDHQEHSSFDLLDFYRLHCVNLGKKLTIHKNGAVINAEGIDISPKGHLVIQTEDGHIENVLSGEVSVRGVNGYI